MISGLASLLLSFLLLSALRISTNPLPEDFGFEVMAWLRDVAAYVGSGLVVAALVLRRPAGPTDDA